MKRREKGLTLIELMVTLAVAIVLLAIGIPAFNAISARDMSAATVNALVTALQQARAEAISRSESVRVCGGPPPTTLNWDCGTAAWSTGWYVLAPVLRSDAVGQFEVIRTYGAPRKEISVTNPGIIEFDARGEKAGDELDITVRAYKTITQTTANCVRETDVIVTPVGQVRTWVKSQCT